MAARCQHIEPTGWREYACRLSGASVEPGCRSLDDSPCIPRQAAMVRAGSLQIKDVSKGEREAVRIMAERLEMKDLNFDELSGEELEEWAARIAGVRRDRRRASRQREKLLPRLQAKLDRLFSKRVALSKDMATIEKQIEGLKEGRPVTITSTRKGPAAVRGSRSTLTEAERREKKAAYQREHRRKAAEERAAA